MNLRPLTSRFVLAASLSVLFACERPPVVRNCNPDASVPCPNLNNPAGRIEGTIIYQGSPPPASTLPGHPGQAAGRIILLLFAYDNPPPPEGTASTAVSFQAISAAQLFQSARVMPDGTVFASLPYSFPNIAQGGVYQIRAFYSHDESISYDPGNGTTITEPSGFHPLFSVRNEPVLGDVGGGALIDPNAPIPHFAPIVVGTASLGADGGATYTIPEEGALVQNVPVFLGRVFDTERPMFHVVTDGMAAPANITVSHVDMPPTSIDPMTNVPTPGDALVRYASDTGLLPVGSPQLNLPRNYVVQHPDTGADLPTFTVAAGFESPSGPMPSQDECAIAAFAGVRCASDPATQIGFFERAFDRNQNGTIDVGLDAMPPFADAHPTLLTTSPIAARTFGHLPWVFPIVVLTKLHEPTESERALLAQGQNGHLTAEQYAQLRSSLNQPEAFDPAHGRYPVLILGTVLPNGSAASLLLRDWVHGYAQREAPVKIGIIPIAIEVHGTNPLTDWWAIVPPGLPPLIAAATPFLPANYVCWDFSADWNITPDFPYQAGVPVGRYAINVINPNEQVWTVPNELSNVPNTMCPPDGCHALSQSLVVRFTEAVAPPAPVVCPDPPQRGFPTQP